MRIISFRFDDGLWEGAIKASKILGDYKATFFIVVDWLDDNPGIINDDFNMGRSHGSLDSWMEMSESGQDVQSHSKSHRRFSTLNYDERITELIESRKLIESIHDRPILFCYPYNDITQDDLKSLGYSGGGFHTMTSYHPIIYNELSDYDPFMLRSWAIQEENFSDICHQLKNLPNDTWTILGLHSLDGEGFNPWKYSYLEALFEFIVLQNFKISTISEVLSKN